MDAAECAKLCEEWLSRYRVAAYQVDYKGYTHHRLFHERNEWLRTAAFELVKYADFYRIAVEPLARMTTSVHPGTVTEERVAALHEAAKTVELIQERCGQRLPDDGWIDPLIASLSDDEKRRKAEYEAAQEIGRRRRALEDAAVFAGEMVANFVAPSGAFTDADFMEWARTIRGFINALASASKLEKMREIVAYLLTPEFAPRTSSTNRLKWSARAARGFAG